MLYPQNSISKGQPLSGPRATHYLMPEKVPLAVVSGVSRLMEMMETISLALAPLLPSAQRKVHVVRLLSRVQWRGLMH